MMFAARIIEPVTFGSFNIVPYTLTSANITFTSCLVYSDNSGNIKWVSRTNLQNFRLFYANNVFHVVGNTFASSPPIKVENTVVKDSTAVSYTHLRAHETPEHLVC